jgi:hypothetical protein
MKFATRPSAVAVTVGVITSMLYGCRGSLPTAPSAQSFEGIIVYEHIDFQGQSGGVARDIGDLGGFKGPCFESDGTVYPNIQETWNDCISSVRVAPGWRATLYRGKDYGDDALEITADVSDLRNALHDCPKGGLNDCVSSIRVRRQ